MVANLRAGNLDGYLAPRSVQSAGGVRGGRVHLHASRRTSGRAIRAAPSRPSASSSRRCPIRSRRHPLSRFSTRLRYATAGRYRSEIAAAVAPRNWQNQPVEGAPSGSSTGAFPETGPGTNRNVADRIDFDPFPYQSMARLDPHPDEALGLSPRPDVSYPQGCRGGTSAAGCREASCAPSAQKAPETNSVKHTFALGKTRVFDPGRARGSTYEVVRHQAGVRRMPRDRLRVIALSAPWASRVCCSGRGSRGFRPRAGYPGAAGGRRDRRPDARAPVLQQWARTTRESACS